MRTTLITLLVGFAFIGVAVCLLRAEEPATRLAFYDAHGTRIGEGEFVFPDHPEDQPKEGKWRFKLAAGYKKPRHDVVSASDMLNKPDWQKLRSGRSSKAAASFNLHPSEKTDWVILIPASTQGLILSGSWIYCTDGGLVEEGSFSSL